MQVRYQAAPHTDRILDYTREITSAISGNRIGALAGATLQAAARMSITFFQSTFKKYRHKYRQL
jgi:hypothetical protein